jgi:hypothetical protein
MKGKTMDLATLEDLATRLHTVLGGDDAPFPSVTITDVRSTGSPLDGQPHMTDLVQAYVTGGLRVYAWLADDGGAYFDISKTDYPSRMDTRASYTILPDEDVTGQVERLAAIFARQVARDTWLHRAMVDQEQRARTR